MNAFDPSHVRYEVNNSIARITLNRPDRRNALTRDMIEKLTESVQAAAANAEIRLLCFAATGPVFCAGMDLAEMQDRATSPNPAELWLQDAFAYRELLGAILDTPCPTLAVVQGPVLAGGVGLLLACDLAIAGESVFLALPEPQRGITAAIVTPLLIYRVGVAQASHLLLGGRRVAAQTARSWGLFHEVAPQSELDKLQKEWCESLLSASPQALTATKQLIRQVAAGSLKEQLDVAAAVSAQARESIDAREGLQAFLEKRPPRWQAPPQTTE